MTDGRHFRDDDTVRLWPPADPWAAHDGRTESFPMVNPAVRNGRRPIYGRVYELFTDRPEDGPHPYVGQTTTTIAKRVQRHKNADSVAKDPWKAHILPGPAGYRLLETVYSTGDCAENERVLNRAEAFWIDRLRPTHNDVRPVRPRHGDPLPARPRESARTVPARAVKSRPRRRVSWRVWLCLVLWALATAGCAVVLHLGGAPEQMIWALSPSFGAGAAWAMTMDIVRRGRRLKAWR
jgi:hypothetical protein